MTTRLRPHDTLPSFEVGTCFEVNGLRLVVAQGRKHPDDRVLLVGTPGQGLQPVRMALAFLLAHFFYANEDVLFPPPYLGGEMFRQHLELAMQDSWTAAAWAVECARPQCAPWWPS